MLIEHIFLRGHEHTPDYVRPGLYPDQGSHVVHGHNHS